MRPNTDTEQFLERKSLSEMMGGISLDIGESREKSSSGRYEDDYASNEIEEPVLESLLILEEREEEEECVVILYHAKGLGDNRYSPYEKKAGMSLTSSPSPATRVLPVLRVERLGQAEPCKLEAKLAWETDNQLRIYSTALPDDIRLTPGVTGGEREEKINIYLQFDPARKELKCFPALIRSVASQPGLGVRRYVGPILVLLKAEISESQEERLLSLTTPEDRAAADKLVAGKEIQQLVMGIPPHNDTVLSVLCAQKNPVSPGQNNAQIHAVVQRLLRHQDGKMKETICKLNNNRISALEIAAITNNHAAAAFLVEVIYNIIEDMEQALHLLNCRDSQGNTIIHLLARKGDTNIKTLRSLLNIKLTDGTAVYQMLGNMRNQYPLHIAAQSRANQPETLAALQERMPECFHLADTDGMTALHYACQRTNDVELVRTILSYKKDNISQPNLQGVTPLDLVRRRSQLTDQRAGLFSIEPDQQANICKLLLNNGAQSGTGSVSVSQSESESESEERSSSAPMLGTQAGGGQSYEDHLASQVLSEFPELSGLLEQILEEQH